MSKAGKTGVSANTPQNIVFGAGTIHKNLEFVYTLTQDAALVAGKTYYTRSGTEGSYVYTFVTSPNVSDIATYYEGAWNFDTSIIGATKEGSTLSIVPEIYEVEPDGAMVSVKGLTVKTGETATLTINFLELTKELIKAAVIGADGTSEDAVNYDLIKSKPDIADGDYFDNIAFVGRTLGGKNIMVILENAICTSGLELEGSNKEAGTVEYEFKCHAELGGDLDALPYKIYYPKATI